MEIVLQVAVSQLHVKADHLEARTDGGSSRWKDPVQDTQHRSGRISHATGVSFSVVTKMN